MKTTRERIIQLLEKESLSAVELAEKVDSDPNEVVDDIRHVAQSVSASEKQLLVAPPECNDCGFNGFDSPANRPSRCPECKSESIKDPVFTIST